MLTDRFKAFLSTLPDRDVYERDELLVPALLLDEDGESGLAIYDAPVGWMNRDARIVLVGVTPGFTQMEILVRSVRRHLSAGLTEDDALRRAKYEASFAGPMRKNLVGMLDAIGLPLRFGIGSSDELFGPAEHLLHTTSAIRNPTFLRGTNYTGGNPRLARTPFLLAHARRTLSPELSTLSTAVFVPLGDNVAELLQLLESERAIPRGRTLFGLPHPSGANGHRVRKFEQARESLRRDLATILR